MSHVITAGADDEGTALVEFALVLPILMLILFGILEFGRAINYWIDSNHLANEAARWAAVNNNPGAPGTLQQWIRNQADSDEMKNGGSSSVSQPASVCLSFPSGTSQVGDPVEAQVSVTYNWMPLLKTGLVSSTLVGSATMRLEVAPGYTAGCA